jgi:hypothetical protein
MRRIALSAGVLAAAMMTGLSGTGSADAASGVLVINGQQYQNPQGCYSSNVSPLSVSNHTDAFAYIYTSSDCTGSPVLALYDDSTVSPFGRSVAIDHGEVAG